MQNSPPQYHPNSGQQSQPPPTNNNGQHWHYNTQTQYNANPGYSSNGYYPPSTPQQFEQPQFISPAQLFQQTPVQPRAPQDYQHTPQTINGRSLSTPSYKSSPRMPLVSVPESGPDKAMLLVSLAEEYFAAAHELAPTIALSMTGTHILAYERLIATGLGCLDTTLKRLKLAPRQEANVRLRYAGVLFEETENFMEGETALSKGISLCERV
jgi:hypothetical protein